jgi:hypothetical protein
LALDLSRGDSPSNVEAGDINLIEKVLQGHSEIENEPV